jgi:hypothetical protein
MGLRAMGVDLINCGKNTVRVNGYPAVLALDEKRQTVHVKVLLGVDDIALGLPTWSGAPRPVTVQPGHRAGAVVVWRNTYDDTRHPPVNAPYLRIGPAAKQPTQVLAVDGMLDLGSTGRLGVSPWRAIPNPTPTTVPTTRPAPPPTSVTPSTEVPLP